MQNARNISKDSANQVNTTTSEDTSSAVLPPNTSSEVVEEAVDDSKEHPSSLASSNLSVANANPTGGVSNQDSTLKKIFHKGKVSINFPSSKGLYSSSDSEIDVDYVEEVQISTKETPSQDNMYISDFHDDETQQGTTLKSVISIPGNSAAAVSIPGTSVQQDENAHYSLTNSNSDRAQHSNESTQIEKHRRRKRKHSRHGESNNEKNHSRRHKKHKKRHKASRSSSVEFVNETR